MLGTKLLIYWVEHRLSPVDSVELS